jgi:maleamate amidohydrolase
MKNSRIWDRYLSAQDQQVHSASGLGGAVGMGTRPALAIIDCTYHFCGDKPEPLLASIARWPYSCGEAAWKSVAVIRRLIDACHGSKIPVFYSTNARSSSGLESGSWRWTSQRELEDPEREAKGNTVVAEIAPTADDMTIYKTKPSMFFGTPFLSYLIELKVDSLFVCGVSTSGCVRATVIDAFSNNLRVQVVEEACFDRTEVSHAINLFDMNAKYADVVSEKEAIAAMEKLGRGRADAA